MILSCFTIFGQDYYDKTGESLTKASDQTVEAAHQFVDRVMNRSCYVVKDITWKEHGNKLLQGEFNIF